MTKSPLCNVGQKGLIERKREREEEEDEDGKKLFDPVGEHLSWNPVRSKTACGEGWLVLANEKTERVEKEPEKDVQQEPKAALQRVRHLLDQWC